MIVAKNNIYTKIVICIILLILLILFFLILENKIINGIMTEIIGILLAILMLAWFFVRSIDAFKEIYFGNNYIIIKLFFIEKKINYKLIDSYIIKKTNQLIYAQQGRVLIIRVNGKNYRLNISNLFEKDVTEIKDLLQS